MKFVRLKFLTDEDFDNDILRGVLLKSPAFDFVRVQDVGLSGASDREVLAFAAREGRVLITHDVSTMPPHVGERLAMGLPMPGVLEVPQSASLREVIEHLILLADCTYEGEVEGQLIYLPLR